MLNLYLGAMKEAVAKATTAVCIGDGSMLPWLLAKLGLPSLRKVLVVWEEMVLGKGTGGVGRGTGGVGRGTGGVGRGTGGVGRGTGGVGRGTGVVSIFSRTHPIDTMFPWIPPLA